MVPVSYMVGWILWTAICFWLIGYFAGKADAKRKRR
jgi:hypothetical protein